MKSDTQSRTESIRVLVADNQALARQALRCLIEAAESFRVVAEAATAGEIAERARCSAVDVIAIDFDMPGLADLDTALWHGSPNTPATVVIAHHHGLADLHRALALGADGYVTKDDDADVLYFALRGAAAGQSFLSPRVTRAVVDSLARPDPAPSASITPGAADTTVPDHDTKAGQG